MVNTISSWLGNLVNAIIGFMLVPFLLGQLGKEGYGLAALVGVIITFTELADLGLRGALSRHLAEQVATKNTQRFNELVSSGLLIYLAIGSLLAIVCAIFAHSLALAFNVSDRLMPQAVFLIRYYGSSAIFLSFITPVYGGTLTSNNRFDIYNIIVMATNLLRGLGLFVVLGFSNSGLYGWSTVTLFCRILGLLLLCRMAHRVWPSLKISYHHIRPGALGMLFSLGGYIFSLQVARNLTVLSGPIVLTIILGPIAVALYDPATKLAAMLRPLVGALARQLHPLATGYHATGRIKELQAVLIRGTRYTVLMAIPVCVVLGVFAHILTNVWLHDKLGNDSVITGWLLVFWMVIELFTFAGMSQWAVFLGKNKLRFAVAVRLPGAVLSVLVAVFLVAYTRLGVVGVIIPTAVFSAVLWPILSIYSARLCGLTPSRYFMEGYFRPIMVLAAMGLAAVALRLFVVDQSFWMLVTCAAGLCLLWVPLCWWLGFDQDDRKSILLLLGRAKTALLQRQS